MSLNRRLFNKLVAANALLAPATVRGAFASDATAPEMEPDLQEILKEQADEGWDASRGILDQVWEPLRGYPGDWNWWTYEQDEKAKPGWISTDKAMDYMHLSTYGPVTEEAFEFTPANLKWLAERNSFSFKSDASRILFGLRGCKLADESFDSDWQEALQLKTAVPNHTDFNCLIGVWDRNHGDAGRIRVFAGSTVPEVSYMWRMMRREQGCNLMPTGLYAYQVGNHRRAATSSTKTRHLGALQLLGTYFPAREKVLSKIVVLRTLDDLTFDPTNQSELWDLCTPGNNIHSAIWEPDKDRSLGLTMGNSNFSSAGCQILRGAYEIDDNRRFTEKATHQWKDFRIAAGLSDPIVMDGEGTTDDGKIFHYMLLTGHEAALAATGGDAFTSSYNVLRIGSTGNGVKNLQRTIGTTEDGSMGPGTVTELLRYQQETLGIQETPVYRY